MADNSMAGTFQLTLPKELVLASARAKRPPHDMLKVDGFKRSWVARMCELLVGRNG